MFEKLKKKMFICMYVWKFYCVLFYVYIEYLIYYLKLILDYNFKWIVFLLIFINIRFV